MDVTNKMNYITHCIGGIGAGLLTINFIGNVDDFGKVAIMAGAVIGSIFPDIDHKKSFIGRKVPIISNIISTAFKHRGFLHTPIFIIFLWLIIPSAISLLFKGGSQHFALLFIKGVITGILSHIILDTFNKRGILWLWPISNKRFRILSIKTDSFVEKLFTIGLIVAICFLYKF
ncbi:metal-dependent hydrolase [Anaerovorax odorimutans]|uniref:metal-dependent hydrolase n=1 Tax=Anaerovorax odorimutans TaxID=109327 RepID=UPI00041D483D|nr:metal-dependent hydrolase [Anaerovorax odorimutans]